ncbi:MAG: hypothetical protein U0232_30880 [Thermomicrobiales bacterium]
MRRRAWSAGGLLKPNSVIQIGFAWSPFSSMRRRNSSIRSVSIGWSGSLSLIPPGMG